MGFSHQRGYGDGARRAGGSCPLQADSTESLTWHGRTAVATAARRAWKGRLVAGGRADRAPRSPDWPPPVAHRICAGTIGFGRPIEPEFRAKSFRLKRGFAPSARPVARGYPQRPQCLGICFSAADRDGIRHRCRSGPARIRLRCAPGRVARSAAERAARDAPTESFRLRFGKRSGRRPCRSGRSPPTSSGFPAAPSSPGSQQNDRIDMPGREGFQQAADIGVYRRNGVDPGPHALELPLLKVER